MGYECEPGFSICLHYISISLDDNDGDKMIFWPIASSQVFDDLH